MESIFAGQRLRSACNECHASKVKCSGERTGCQRCISSGYDCQFEVSMVGRCSKGRQRRKRSAVETFAGDASSMRRSELSPKAPGRTDPNSTRNSRQTRSFRPLPPVSMDSPTNEGRAPIDLDFASLLNSDSYGLGFPDLCPDGDNNRLFTDRNTPMPDDALGDALNLLDMPSPIQDYTSELRMAFSISSGTKAAQIAPPLTPVVPDATRPPTATPRTSENTGQHKGNFEIENGSRTLFDVISNLEAELGDSGSSIDKIMHTVNTSTKEVERVIRARQWQAEIGPRLAFVAIEVSLILIENIVSRWSGSKNLNNPTNNEPRALLLGQYMAESDEVVIIWRRIIVVELRRLRKLIEALGVYLDDSSRCHNGKQPVGRLKNCCAYQEQKVALLIASLQRHDQIIEGGDGLLVLEVVFEESG